MRAVCKKPSARPFAFGPILDRHVRVSTKLVAEESEDRSAMSEQLPEVMEVVLAQPRGFCAGVDRAIEIVERALLKFGAPIYVRHEIVHNTFVVNDLKSKGAIFIEDLAEVPPGATLVFSAHGVSQAVRKEAAARGFSIFDA